MNDIALFGIRDFFTNFGITLGAIMVIGGFVLLNVAYVYETKHEKKGLGASLWEKIWCKSCQINWKKRRRQ
jgi:hypothetical protein